MSHAIHASALEATAQRPATRTYAWSVFAIVFALMVFDYVDRQVIVSMFPHLKAQWSLSDSQLGGLVSVISITVALGAIPLSLLADRWSRVKSIFVMAVMWSVATIACALATEYFHLLVLRSAVGLGEAAYGTAGAALLASLFPDRMRSTILGAFLAAGIVGSVLGVIAGGVISHHWGWQAGFGAVGVPGVLLAILFVLMVRDDERLEPPKQASVLPVRALAAEMVRSRTMLLTCVGAGLQLVMVSTTWAWMPSYLNRYYNLATDKAGMLAGVVVLVGGFGALAWSVVSDRLKARHPAARLYVPAAVGVATAVLMFAAFSGLEPGRTQFMFIVAGAAVMTGTVGPAAAVVVDVTHPALRATGLSILSVMQNLFGLAAGPILAGYLSDKHGLPFALSVVPVFCLLASACFALAARTYGADIARAEKAA
jgi:predicted MFS family arabinose efflux permease